MQVYGFYFVDGLFVHRRMLNESLKQIYFYCAELLLSHVAWKVLFSPFYCNTMFHFQCIGFSLTSKTNLANILIYIRFSMIWSISAVSRLTSIICFSRLRSISYFYHFRNFSVQIKLISMCTLSEYFYKNILSNL